MLLRIDVIDFVDIYLLERSKFVLLLLYSYRNGFLKSMVDFLLWNGFWKSVMFEEDFYVYKEML